MPVPSPTLGEGKNTLQISGQPIGDLNTQKLDIFDDWSETINDIYDKAKNASADAYEKAKETADEWLDKIKNNTSEDIKNKTQEVEDWIKRHIDHNSTK
jgi:thiamine pyrophosphate-dependent acetolactate synthase large subunit-like protein